MQSKMQLLADTCHNPHEISEPSSKTTFHGFSAVSLAVPAEDLAQKCPAAVVEFSSVVLGVDDEGGRECMAAQDLQRAAPEFSNNIAEVILFVGPCSPVKRFFGIACFECGSIVK